VWERERNALEIIDIGNDFLNRAQMAQQLSKRVDDSAHQNKWSSD
jgi:hypothetical protein